VTTRFGFPLCYYKPGNETGGAGIKCMIARPDPPIKPGVSATFVLAQQIIY